jgi:RHS repeat-associated protein
MLAQWWLFWSTRSSSDRGNSPSNATGNTPSTSALAALDDRGNRATMEDATGTYTTTYDVTNQAQTVTSPAAKTVTYAYNEVGSRAHMVDADGGRFTYSYDAAGRLDVLVNPQADRTTFSYDAANRRTLKKLGNGTRASFSYDATGQLTALYNLKPSAAVISSFDYRYDAVGHRSDVAEANGDRVTYSYDDAYQLTAAHRSGTNAYAHTNTYDAAGNRTVKNEDNARTTSTYDAANQLVTALAAAGTTTYTFDANGNQQVVLEPSSDRTTNTWDFENRNTKVQLPAGTLNTYTYNGDGQRVKVENSAGTSKMVWDGQQYLAETDGSDVTFATYTNLPDQFTNLVSQHDGTATTWLHFDALGSTRDATNSSETVTDTFLYDAWGNQLDRTGTTRILFRYTGQHGYYYDIDTALSYVLARMLDPVTARWLSFDPLNFIDGPNRFLFAWNNPLVYLDRSGLACDVGPGIRFIPGRGKFTLLDLTAYVRDKFWDNPNDTIYQSVGSSFHLQWHAAGFIGVRDVGVVPDPNSPWACGCECCCEIVAIIQIATTTRKGLVPYSIPWGIDKGIPYPKANTINPCPEPLFRPEERYLIRMRDKPGSSGRFLTQLKQEFETCVVCLGGIEGPHFGDPVRLPSGKYTSYLDALGVYGCVKWGHDLTYSRFKHDGVVLGHRVNFEVNRWITIGDVTYFADENTREIELAQRGVLPMEGDPPSRTFRQVLTSTPIEAWM